MRLDVFEFFLMYIIGVKLFETKIQESELAAGYSVLNCIAGIFNIIMPF